MSVLRVADEVQHALDRGRPVVALESTIISHGLPRPRNLAAAHELEQLVRDGGATPATIAVLDGVPRVGLDDGGLRRVAEEELDKASVRDLAVLVALGRSGATTVAATAHLAAAAGVRVFATGGLGGVHRGAAESFDESADLLALARTRIAVVCAGVKSVLDIGATLERLESLSVPVVGYRTGVFPSFWLTASDHRLDWELDGPDAVARVLHAQDDLGDERALVVANPVPLEEQWDPVEHDRVLALALEEAAEQGVHGKAVTPFLLQRIVELSSGRSLEVNLHLARNNVRTASQIAAAYASHTSDDG